MQEKAPTVLIVDDQEDIRWALRMMVRKAGMNAREASNGYEALEEVRKNSIDAILLDVLMPEMDGFEVYRRVREIDGSVPVILITAFGSIKDAVKMIREGAFDYLSKPLHTDEVISTIMKAITLSKKKLEKSIASREYEASLPLQERMGYSPKIQKIASEIKRVAPTDISVLIVGETGAGKEVVAQAIHEQSSRKDNPFVAMDCGAIPESLFESELFGHEKGSFTGAISRKTGKFEAAENGTLFLDEIANIPLSMQSKFLRVLQERTFFRIGAQKPLQANVRVIAATNKEFKDNSDWDDFRTDLYYRLAEYIIYVPPLRERKEDILYLVKKFFRQANIELGRNVLGISEKALDALYAYDWPGNVRELKNVVKRSVLLADEIIEIEHLGMFRSTDEPIPEPQRSDIPIDGDCSLKKIVQERIEDVEKEVLKKVLEKTGGNKAETARILKIDYKTIHTKIKKYGISTDDK